MAQALVSGLRGYVGHTHPIEVVELIPSGGGVFDVFADGELIFSKKKEGRYPAVDEIIEALEPRLRSLQ